MTKKKKGITQLEDEKMKWKGLSLYGGILLGAGISMFYNSSKAEVGVCLFLIVTGIFLLFNNQKTFRKSNRRTQRR